MRTPPIGAIQSDFGPVGADSHAAGHRGYRRKPCGATSFGFGIRRRRANGADAERSGVAHGNRGGPGGMSFMEPPRGAPHTTCVKRSCQSCPRHGRSGQIRCIHSRQPSRRRSITVAGIRRNAAPRGALGWPNMTARNNALSLYEHQVVTGVRPTSTTPAVCWYCQWVISSLRTIFQFAV